MDCIVMNLDIKVILELTEILFCLKYSTSYISQSP